MIADTQDLRKSRSSPPDHRSQPARSTREDTSPSVRLLLYLMEAVVLGCLVLAPWAFGAAEPAFEFLLNAAVCLLLALWGLRMLLEWRFIWRKCPVVLCLAGLFLTGMVQVVPLPRDVLGWLAPATASLYEQLLPATPEVLPDEQARLTASPPAGSTLSLYPGATKRELLRLLAVLALFAVVRNNLASPAAFRRLSIAVVANGALLALLGLLQFFTSPPHVLYWTFPSPGMVFGPFVCRTHFACWANICIGLGVGLLLTAAHSTPAPTLGTRSLWEQILDKVSAPLSLLQGPRVLWVAVALALLLSGVLFSLSRGGVLALLGGFLVAGVIRLRRRVRASVVPGVLLGLALAAGLAVWFGLGAVQGRLTTLLEGKALEESRLPLWKSTLPVIRDFPVWGTGYGTFQYVEPRHRDAAAKTTVVYDHAHNEYLEALVEGGVIRLAWSLLAIAAVLRLGWRAVRRHEGRSAAGLALGGLFAVVTLVLHSVGDFGLHLPAIAFLAAVVCAHLCGLGEGRNHAATEGEQAAGAPARESVFSLGGVAPVLGAVVLLLVGLLLVGESWRADRVEKWRFAAHHLRTATDPAGRDRRIAYLEEAARRAPESAWVHAELGEAYFDAFEKSMERTAARARTHDTAQTVAAFLSASSPGTAPRALSSQAVAALALERLAHDEEERWTRQYVVPGLRHVLRARDLGPLLGRPHFLLAAHREALAGADSRLAYLGRAKALLPFDPAVWYVCGLQELLDDQRDLACASWRHALELSDEYLGAILEASAPHLTASEALGRVLPDRPALLYAAATHFYPQAGQTAERRPFLERALALLDGRSLGAADLRLRAVLCRALGRREEAIAAYQEALRGAPNSAEWQYELAEVLTEQGKLAEAREELLVLLGRQPGHVAARELLEAMNRAGTERRQPSSGSGP